MSVDRMSKLELLTELRSLGYTEDQLNGIKKPELMEKLKAERLGSEGLDLLSNTQESALQEDDVGVAVVQDTEKTGDANNDDTMANKAGIELMTPEDFLDKSNTDLVDLVDSVDSESKEKTTTTTDPPTPNDKEWTQYVLGHFADDEVDGKNPRVEGLRRVAGLLVGTIMEEGCDLVAPPTEDNRFRACVKAWFVFRTHDGLTKRFEALADAHADNCLEDYATYLVAMADTRAKGRVLRNALGLKRVVAAEEVSKTMAPAADIQKGGSIITGQITIIRMTADRHNFDIKEVLNRLEIPYELDDHTGEVKLQSLSYEEAVATATEMRLMKEAKEKE
jgi:hypothetical protein